MANTKISALTAATSVAGNETIPAAVGGANVSMTPELLASVLAHPGYVAARWYAPLGVVATNGVALVQDQVRLTPFIVPSRITISDLGVRITTAAASGNIKLGIYASNATTKMPTGSVLGTCTVSTTSTGTVSATLGANVSLTPGLYWLASLPDNSTVICNSASGFSAFSVASAIGDASLGNVTPASLQLAPVISTSVALGYTNGLTSMTSQTFISVSTTGQNAYIFFKVTSVP